MIKVICYKDRYYYKLISKKIQPYKIIGQMLPSLHGGDILILGHYIII